MGSPWSGWRVSRGGFSDNGGLGFGDQLALKFVVIVNGFLYVTSSFLFVAMCFCRGSFSGEKT